MKPERNTYRFPSQQNKKFCSVVIAFWVCFQVTSRGITLSIKIFFLKTDFFVYSIFLLMKLRILLPNTKISQTAWSNARELHSVYSCFALMQHQQASLLCEPSFNEPLFPSKLLAVCAWANELLMKRSSFVKRLILLLMKFISFLSSQMLLPKWFSKPNLFSLWWSITLFLRADTYHYLREQWRILSYL